MKKINKLTIVLFMLLNFGSYSLAENNFFEKGKNKYDKKKYEESKFLFQRNIVFNPKDESSYLYLAKIYENEKNEKKKEQNIDTVLLLNPKNEEAIFMLMEIELKKSNYSKVRELEENFTKICIKLCNNKELILESLNIKTFTPYTNKGAKIEWGIYQTGVSYWKREHRDKPYPSMVVYFDEVNQESSKEKVIKNLGN